MRLLHRTLSSSRRRRGALVVAATLSASALLAGAIIGGPSNPFFNAGARFVDLLVRHIAWLPPLIIVAAIGQFLWRRSQRSDYPGESCPECGFRMGHRVGRRCPECGKIHFPH